MKSKNTVLASAALIGLIVFLYYFSGVLSDLNSWNAWDQPAEVSKMIKAAVFGLIAFAAGIGIDVKALVGQFVPRFGADNVVSDQTRADLSAKDHP